MVKASVGRELGPQLPESVLLLRIRQKPPVTVRDLGLSIVAVGCDAALAITSVAVIPETAKNRRVLFFFAMVG